MITGTLILFALVLGYVVVIGLSLAATFGITAARPNWVTKGHRLTCGYKLLQALVWLVCVTAGSFVTAAVAGSVDGFIVGAMLAAILICVLWASGWEARQRGMAHQILMSLVVVAGVSAGYALRLR